MRAAWAGAQIGQLTQSEFLFAPACGEGSTTRFLGFLGGECSNEALGGKRWFLIVRDTFIGLHSRASVAMPGNQSDDAAKRILLFCGIFIFCLLVLCVVGLFISFEAGCIGFKFDRPGFILFCIFALSFLSYSYYKIYVGFDVRNERKEPDFVRKYFSFINRDEIKKLDSNRIASEACIMQAFISAIMVCALFYYIFHNNPVCSIPLLNSL